MFFRKKKEEKKESVTELPNSKPESEFGYYINATTNGYGSFGAFLILTPETSKISYYSYARNREETLAFILSKLKQQVGEVSVRSDLPNIAQELVSPKNEYIRLLKIICDYLCGYPLSVSDKLLIVNHEFIEGIPEDLVKACVYDIEGMRADY